MKKWITLTLAAGLFWSGLAGTAKAVELRSSGTYEFGFSWADTALEKHDPADTFHAVQRIRQ